MRFVPYLANADRTRSRAFVHNLFEAYPALFETVDGVRLMAAERKVRAIDIGEAWWQDVDTPEMLAHAEQEVARLLL